MTTTTPLYGITGPDATTKLKDLGVELQGMLYDIEAALAAADIPPVTPAPVMVAATAAARDAYWGVPGDEAARITLQNRGATTIRTDTGRTERYYATYNATTNPAGAITAGWYGVVSGSLLGASGQALPSAATVVTFPQPPSLEGVTQQSGGLLAPISGRYLIAARAQATLQGTNQWRNFQVVRGADTMTLGSTAATLQPDGANNVVAALAFETPLTAGDVLTLRTNGSGNATMTATHIRVGFSITLIR